MFVVDRSLPQSLPAQIAQGFRSRIDSGQLTPGDQVPSTRELARTLNVSRGSVVTAYDQLLSEGFFLATQGAPTRIHPLLANQPRHSSPLPSPHRRVPATPRISLKPSSGHAGVIRPAAWRRAWREAAAEPPSTLEPAGQLPLRQAIADHLRLARGFVTSPDNVIVTGGSREGLMLILASAGVPARIGVEDPGHPGLRRIIPLLGHDMVPCSTDRDGVDPRSLPEDLDFLLVTPSYQFPDGGSMPAARRYQLLSWAQATGTTLVEDDFNAELRYRIAPLPTLAAAGGQVLTLGTFSTLLSKTLSAGYVIASDEQRVELLEVRTHLGQPVSAVTQLAIAYLLEQGYVARNTKAAQARMTRRRDTIEAKVLPALDHAGAQVVEMANSHRVEFTVTFPTEDATATFEKYLAEHGIEAGQVTSLWSERAPGFVISFAHVADDDFETAVEVLAGFSSAGFNR